VTPARDARIATPGENWALQVKPKHSDSTQRTPTNATESTRMENKTRGEGRLHRFLTLAMSCCGWSSGSVSECGWEEDGWQRCGIEGGGAEVGQLDGVKPNFTAIRVSRRWGYSPYTRYIIGIG
jgi:hypothetical protein